MSWLEINSESEANMCKVKFEGDLIHFYYCNFVEIFKEVSCKSDLLQRAKDLNLIIEFDDAAIIEGLSNIIPIQAELQTPTDAAIADKILCVKYYLEDRPFHFKWNLKKTTSAEFFELVTRPLLLSLAMSNRRDNKLKDIIRKKDMEIEQYKGEGAVLKRSLVETTKFSEIEFGKTLPPFAADFLPFAIKNYDNYAEDHAFFINPLDRKAGSSGENEEPKPTLSEAALRIANNPKYLRARLIRERLSAQKREMRYLLNSAKKASTTKSDKNEDLNKSLAELRREHIQNLKTNVYHDNDDDLLPDDEEAGEGTSNKRPKMTKKKFNL